MVELAFLAVAPAIILGAISGDGPRFMLYNIVGLAAAWTLGLVLALRSADSAHGTVATRTCLGLLIMAGFAIAAVATQYRSRRWGRAVTQLLSGVVLGTTAAAYLPFDASALFKTTKPTPAKFADQVQFSVHLLSVNPNPGPRDTHEVSISVDVEGMPPKTSIARGFADVELSWTDGTRSVAHDIWLMPRDTGANKAVAEVLGIPFRTQIQRQMRKCSFRRMSGAGRKARNPSLSSLCTCKKPGIGPASGSIPPRPKKLRSNLPPARWN